MNDLQAIADRVELEGDTAVGRAYISEFGHMRDGRSQLHYSLYHDRYERTPDGWKFAERRYEIRYLDTTPLAGSPPHAERAPTNSPTEDDGQASSAQRSAGRPCRAGADEARGGPGGE